MSLTTLFNDTHFTAYNHICITYHQCQTVIANFLLAVAVVALVAALLSLVQI
jgi:hypothetical protein